MIIKRLILKNFRQFEGEDNRMDFNLVGDKHITLVFAANGVGKTTILSAIDWCLYGGKEILYGDHKDIFLNKNIFEKMLENEEKKVEIILSFEDRKHEYVVKRSLIVKKVENKQVNIEFKPPQVEIDDELQHDGPKRIESVLSKAMRGYFFFKGEGVGKYADSANSKLVQKGIKNIMKIDFREQAKSLIEKVRKNLDKESAQLQEKQGAIDVPEARRKEIEDEIEINESKILKAEEDIEIFDELLTENQESLSRVKSTKHLDQKAGELRAQISKINETKNQLIDDQKSLITKSAYLALSNEVFQTTNSILEEKRKKGELPIIGIGREFIEDIIAKNQCICGEQFVEGDSHHEELIKIMNQATAKSGIESTVSTLGSFVVSNLNKHESFNDEFRKKLTSLTKFNNEISKLEQQLEAVEDKILKDLPAEDNLMKRRNELKSDRDKAIAFKAKSEEIISILNKELKKVDEQIARSSNHDDKISLIRKRIAFCQGAIDMLEEENEIEIEKIRLELTSRLQKQFSKILHSNKTAELDEDFKLNILENGQPSPKSDGENKLISLIFISTLINMARERESQKENDSIDPGAGIYPMIIDSPYGEFDTVYKRNISQAVKELSPQVIILMNQEHWDGGKIIGKIFENSIAHQYALIAHRTKVEILESEKNILTLSNDDKIDLETQDSREFVKIQKIGATAC